MKTLVWTFLALTALSSAARADLELRLAEPFPVVGQEQVVTLLGQDRPDAAWLFVTYRPNSATAKTVPVGRFDEHGTIRWQPDAPGITTLRARSRADGEPDQDVLASENVATCFAGPPALGIVVMILAGLLLFGGALVSLVKALQKPPES